MRCEVVFHGRVQGVGFRATTRALAVQEGVVGWVRNEPDGTVRMVAEGDDARVSRLLDRIQEQMAGFIRRTDVTEAAAAGAFAAFEIRR